MIEFKAVEPAEVLHDIHYRNGEFPQVHMVVMTRLLVACYVDGKPVAACGFIPQHEGVESIWALISDDVRGHGVGFIRGCRRIINGHMSAAHLHRLQAFCNPGNHEYHRFLSMLGFKNEGYLRHYSPDGQSISIYGKVI